MESLSQDDVEESIDKLREGKYTFEIINEKEQLLDIFFWFIPISIIILSQLQKYKQKILILFYFILPVLHSTHSFWRRKFKGSSKMLKRL